ncbi:type IV secretory system conjugative DNA transfer family protein [Pelagibius sp. Alg239-R121]|uniref:type IV secretory system conjugative DNA transfer family protein n=1 Tax=Pelagibius sp. Alg239-R121 TaxID=2993448 RepID=UPI0024A6C236|nr:type IV secretory system conjugative DNA transfer family protein [Pelagibius sp. Alg239-R121]
MLKVNTHHFYTIGFALLSVPFWASLWIAHKHYGSVEHFTPWLVITTKDALTPDAWTFSWQAGFVGALAIGALLFYLFDGVIFGVKSTDAHGDARWATRKEIKKSKLLERWGVTLGKLGKPKSGAAYLRVNDVELSNMLVSAPPRSGKGTGIIIPTLLDYLGSVIVYDVKGENYEATARQRVKMGDRVLVFSPFDMELENIDPSAHSLKRVSHCFNPLIEIAALNDLEDRLTRIQALASALLSARKDSTEGSLLKDGKRIFVAVSAIVCNEPDPTLAKVSSLLTPMAKSADEVADYRSMFAELAKRAPDPLSHSDLLKASAQDNKSLGIYLAVLQGAGLEAWNEPAIIRATSRNDFDFSTLRTEPTSIYLAIPNQYKDVAAPVVRLFFQTAILALQEKRPGKEFLPVLFMIDEFHSLGRMQGVVDATTILPGYGGRLCLIVQTPASLLDIYGQHASQILMDLTQVKVWMAPNSEDTKQMVSRSLGTETIAVKSVSGRAWGTKEQQSQSFSEKGRALMTPEEVGRLDPEQLIITVQNRFPIRANKVRHWKDKHYSKLWKSQDGMTWPEIPSVKDGDVTSYEGFLKPAEGMPKMIDPVKVRLDTEAEVGQRQPIGSILPPEESSKTGEDSKDDIPDPLPLNAMVHRVKTANFKRTFDNLLQAAPVTSQDSAELKKAAQGLSPEILRERLKIIIPSARYREG